MLQERINALIEKGQESKISNFISSLEIKTSIPKELQDKLDLLGNTPIAEPKIYDAILASEEDGKAVIALAVLTEDEIVKYSAKDIGNFIYAVENRVKNIQDENGNFKFTPLTEGCKIPNFLESDQLQRLAVKQNKILMSLQAEYDESKVKEYTSAIETYNTKAFEISGLDIDTLSDWEKVLVISQVTASATDAFNCAAGKGLGN